jgi:hypothetical protein
MPVAPIQKRIIRPWTGEYPQTPPPGVDGIDYYSGGNINAVQITIQNQANAQENDINNRNYQQALIDYNLNKNVYDVDQANIAENIKNGV